MTQLLLWVQSWSRASVASTWRSQNLELNCSSRVFLFITIQLMVWGPHLCWSVENQWVDLPLVLRQQTTELVHTHICNTGEVSSHKVDPAHVCEHKDLAHHKVQMQVAPAHLVDVGNCCDVVVVEQDTLAQDLGFKHVEGLLDGLQFKLLMCRVLGLHQPTTVDFES